METKIVMSDPTALGVFGLAMVTFVAVFPLKWAGLPVSRVYYSLGAPFGLIKKLAVKTTTDFN